MIDIQNEVFNYVSAALTEEYPDIFISCEDMVNAAPSYPCVSIVEADNYVDERTKDSSGYENYAHVMYEVNVYTTNPKGKITEARKIYDIVDRALERKGFARISCRPWPMNSTLYRMIGRYVGLVDARTHVIYRG